MTTDDSTRAMTQDDLRAHLAADPAVRVTVAAEGDGSPAIAWGDTFVYACDERGEPKKMPFVTIVTKDYEGFDEESKLNRGELHRLNIEVGKAKFEELFGFAPKELDAHRTRHDFAALDRLFPHPVYGTHGWASIINPSEASREAVTALLDFARDRALARVR
jgi:hypothetical protein